MARSSYIEEPTARMNGRGRLVITGRSLGSINRD
jgi:hypothetical protein